MKITRISISNVRSLKNVMFQPSENINVFLGNNNSGKSTILKCIYKIQKNDTLNNNDISLDENEISVLIMFTKSFEEYLLKFSNYKPNPSINVYPVILYKINSKQQLMKVGNSHDERLHVDMPNLQNTEPNNLIIPYLSKRKVQKYLEGITKLSTLNITGTLENIHGKTDRIYSPDLPQYTEFKNACEDIFGITISTFQSENGKKAGITVNENKNIDLEVMGEGTANILGLLVDLCFANKKIFLIEEPENEIQPNALKKLLDIIIKKSEQNQFFITTHSNIVVKYLGASPNTSLFKLEHKFENRIPISTIYKLESPDQRIKALEDMGYELLDFDLWKGWLILEESSAETLIREYFIKWYAHGLINKLRTISACGVDRVESVFDDFQRLFVFVHLAGSYTNRAWVIADANGKKIIEKLRDKYKSIWSKDNFKTFTKINFEDYYPDNFSKDVSEIIQEQDNRKKQTKKKALLTKVLDWIKKNENEAKEKFEISAKEVIEILKDIEKKLS